MRGSGSSIAADRSRKPTRLEVSLLHIDHAESRPGSLLAMSGNLWLATPRTRRQARS